MNATVGKPPGKDDGQDDRELTADGVAQRAALCGVVDAKLGIEEKIRRIIDDFEKKTGFRVGKVSLDRADRRIFDVDRKGKLTGVGISVELPL